MEELFISFIVGLWSGTLIGFITLCVANVRVSNGNCNRKKQQTDEKNSIENE